MKNISKKTIYITLVVLLTLIGIGVGIDYYVNKKVAELETKGKMVITVVKTVNTKLDDVKMVTSMNKTELNSFYDEKKQAFIDKHIKTEK